MENNLHVLDTDGYVNVPVERYVALIRAETECNILESAIRGQASYSVENVMDAILEARKREREMDTMHLLAVPKPEATDAE